MYIFLKSYILKSSVHTLNHEHPDSRPNKKFVNFYFHSSFVVPEKGLYALMNGHFPFWPKFWHLYHNLFRSVKGKPKKLSSTLHTDG